MTEQEIKNRIEKKEKDIEKIEKRIQKWTTGMNEEAKKIVASCELVYDDPKLLDARKKYTAYEKEHYKDPTVFRQDYDHNKGPNFGEAYRAYRDLAEAKLTLNKYKTQLDKLENFNNMEKIPAIWDFLQEWRKAAYDFFIENIKLYHKLQSEEQSKWEEFKKTPEYSNKVTVNKFGRVDDWYIHRDFRSKYYSDIHRITYDVYKYNGKWDDEKLNKILDKDVQNKYNDFVHRITEKAGVIQDASGLRIGSNGVINGMVIGDKNKVRVETILAGGYNIQILHYRVLVHIIK